MNAIRRRQLVIAVVVFTWLAGSSTVDAQQALRTHDVVYGRKFGMALVMDVMKPAKQNGAGVLFMVSGAFQSGIELVNPDFFDPANFKHYLDRGFTVFLVSHGSQPRFTVDEAVSDVRRAVRFIRVHADEYGVDPERLGVFGASSGGYLSLMLGATGTDGNPSADDAVDRASSAVQAVACFCPPSDWVNWDKPGHSVVEYDTVRYVWHVFGVQGRPKDEQTNLLAELSPINLVTRAMPPTLIMHGDVDDKVPHDQSVRFIAKLEELGVPNNLITRKGGHVWPYMPNDHAILADWFDKYLPDAEKDPE